ncbi:response regulator transcription factor [Paenibacillus protaetiae]|uniref:Response regulator transcription factor n=2 Tax=Paenibacillus protaetiae TaxID=2509456 RepID=A0A4P6F2B2_9BACL|nr:response regulator transcription factor [Paenibacillus protaetiae]
MSELAAGKKIKVLIVDDHPHGREGIRDIIRMDSSFDIVGEADSGEAALAAVQKAEPDLILMDIHMPGMGGLEATQQMKLLYPSVIIVMVTVSDDSTHLFEAIKRGAQGYLLKNLAPSSWLEYLRAVAVDEAPVSKELAYRLLREFDPAQKTPARTSPSDWPKPDRGDETASPLTNRELEILEQVALGFSNKAVAEAFGLSEHTVKNHLKNILQKLHLRNRVQLVRYAIEKGMASGDNKPR